MIREMYYEESAVPVNARKEEKLNKGFTIAAIVFSCSPPSISSSRS